MSKVILDITMSLDGFISGPGEDVEQLHDWLFSGDKKSRSTDFFRLSEESLEVFEDLVESTGAIITGRRTFDFAKGWNGNHPVHDSVFEVSHNIPVDVPNGSTTFTFVTDGVESAVRQAKHAAGEKNVYLMGGADIVQQCIRAGLVDGMTIHLVPILLGDGTSLFKNLGDNKIAIVQNKIIEAPGVTHLNYLLKYEME